MEFKTLNELSVDGKGHYGIGAPAVKFNQCLPTYLRITDITEDGMLFKDSLKSVDDSNHKKYILKKNDIVFARTGNSTGKSYFYEEDDGELVYAGFLIKFSLDSEKVNPRYIKYFTLTNEYKGWVSSNFTGSTRPNINAQGYGNLLIPLLSREKQDTLVKILDSIDNKIKINKNIIANLEELSQTLFKRWFIDFEFPDENGSPYKSSKGKMKKSSIGKIPAHWEITDIQEMTTKFTTGLNPRKNFTLGEGSNYYVTIKNMGNNDIILDERCDKVTDEAIEIINKRSDLQVGDVLFSGIGTIGRTYLIYKDPHNWNTSESIFSLRPSDKISSVYLYNLLLSEGVQDYSVQMSSGSVQKGIRKRDLERYTFALSNDNIEDYFEELVSPLQNKIHNLRDENLKLVELRDTLLPKLMSGEIELPDELEVNDHEELLQ